MNSHERDDRELIRYLVGALTDEEAARLDELSIADDRFAADLHAAEHELVDAYVRGTLDGDTRRRFETHYLSSSDGRSKVAFARALQKYRSGRRRLAAHPLVQWGLAAAAAVLLAAAGYLFADNIRLKRQLLDARVGLEQRQQQLEQQLRQEQSANAETRQELERVRQSLAQRQGSTTPVVAFVLVPPTRGVAEIPTLSIPRGTGGVSLQINLESDDVPGYRVALRDSATGRIIWRSGELQPTTRGGAKALSITLDAALLQARTYTLEVTGLRGRGTAEPVGNYPFKVVLQ